MTFRIGVKLPLRFASAGEFLADVQAYEAAGAHSLWAGEGEPRGAEDAQAPGLEPWRYEIAHAPLLTRRLVLEPDLGLGGHEHLHVCGFPLIKRSRQVSYE